MKKKILYISQCFPLPLDGGGKIKTFNTMNALSKYFDIYSVFVSEKKAFKNDLHLFKKKNIKIKVFQTNMMSENIKKNYLKLIWNYLQFRPHFVYQYRYKPAFAYIKKIINSWKPDIIHIDHINSSQFLPSKIWLKRNLKKQPILILENHNLNHLIFKTRYRETNKFIRKIYLLIEGTLNLIYGLINYRRYDHIFCISNEERTYLKKYYKSVITQPLVYPLPIAKTIKDKKEKFDILFVGYLQWPPNEVAIVWFIEKILPLINIKIPNAMFHIVGKSNEKLDIYKNNQNVVFHGYQKNLDHFLFSSKVFVLPFKTGAGIRIKCLTALQNGIPIVSTKMGVEGLKLKNNNEYLQAESEEDFSKKVIKLLLDNKLRERISKKEKLYFINNHSTDSNKLFIKKYLKLCKTI